MQPSCATTHTRTHSSVHLTIERNNTRWATPPQCSMPRSRQATASVVRDGELEPPPAQTPRRLTIGRVFVPGRTGTPSWYSARGEYMPCERTRPHASLPRQAASSSKAFTIDVGPIFAGSSRYRAGSRRRTEDAMTTCVLMEDVAARRRLARDVLAILAVEVVQAQAAVGRHRAVRRATARPAPTVRRSLPLLALSHPTGHRRQPN